MQDKIDRRQFLKQTLALGATFGAASLLSPLTKQLMAAVNDCDLAVVKGPVLKAAAEAIRLMGGMQRFVKPGDKVLIKPNMSFPNPPSSASNTHPDLLRTVVKQCLDSGAKKVLVVDHVLGDPQLCLNKSGLAPACKDLKGVHVLAVMEEKFFVDFPIKNGKVLDKVKVIRDVVDADVIINLPIAKSHSTTGVTMSLKNLMGLIWDRKHFHKNVDINKAIAELNMAINPQLTILDASRALTTGGPYGPGEVVKLNTLVAGVDRVAVDSFGVELTQWYGKRFKGTDVAHIVNAHKLGCGQINPDKLRIKRAYV